MNNEHQRLYALTEHILGLMQENQGAISFQRWMDTALYQPKLGYYEHEQVFGKSGDFTTATAMGNWLALGFADSIQQSWHALGCPETWTLIEQGGGSGELMVKVLQALATRDLQPSHVIAIEKSAQLRQRQQQAYAAQHLVVQQFGSLQDVAPVPTAIFFSNELPDAFAVPSFVYQDGKTVERGVDWDGGKFIWQPLHAINTHIPQHLQAQWQDGYISEYNPALVDWQANVAAMFERGMVLTVDYGYSQQEYYRSNRIQGTLMGHYQHRVVEDVLQLSPGLCDITAHVNFSALIQAGKDAGLAAVAYTSQGAWLAQAATVQQQLQQLASQPTSDNFAQINQAKRLMLPNGMGESFKLLVQSKGISQACSQTLVAPAFDRLHTL